MSEDIVSQELAQQNIFDLLGVKDGTPEEREDFLNRLQQAVWDDFLANDLAVLIGEGEQLDTVQQMNQRDDWSQVEKQQQIITYLTTIIPNLETIMYDKALKLKENLVMERLISLEQAVADSPEKMMALGEIRGLVIAGRWHDVGEKLNNFTF